jgi:hypothetical protein
MGWQLQRGLLNPLDDGSPGSPWWRAVNERLLRDTCEARLRVLGHPGPASSPSVEPSVRFARHPLPRTWYVAHTTTIVRAYIEHHDLAERENRIERFFINLVLVRVLYAHALVAAPRLALAWLAPIARWLGDPRLDVTGMFLSVSRVLPHVYPLEGELDDFIADEHPSAGFSTWVSSRPASPSCIDGLPTSCRSQMSPTSCATPRRHTRGIPTTESPGRPHRHGLPSPRGAHSHHNPAPASRRQSAADAALRSNASRMRSRPNSNSRSTLYSDLRACSPISTRCGY